MTPFRGVMDREKAAIGIFISLEAPTKPMRTEAASAGFVKTAWGNHPRLQLFTVEELLDGRVIDAPTTQGTNLTYKQSPKAVRKVAEPKGLWDKEHADD